MVRGTTPTLTLTIPGDAGLDLTEVRSVYVTIRQDKKSVTLSGEDLTVEPHAVSFHLSQSDSLGLTADQAEVQMNWLYQDAESGDLRRGATLVKRLAITKQLLAQEIGDDGPETEG